MKTLKFLRRGDTFLKDFRKLDPFAKGVTAYEKQYHQFSALFLWAKDVLELLQVKKITLTTTIH